jgi:methyl-accepting chemotaxis protein
VAKSGYQDQQHPDCSATQAVNELESVTQQNAALVEETAAAAMSLQQQAEALAHEVAKFQLPENT